MAIISTLTAKLLLAFVAFPIAYYFYRIVRDPLGSIPGPLLAKFTRLWYLNAINEGDFEIKNIELHRKYGPIIRVGPNMYSINDPEALSIIYSTQNPFPKSSWYQAFGVPGIPNQMSTQSNKYAAEVRKRQKPMFDAYYKQEYAVDDCLKLLEQRLSDFAASGKELDIGWWLTCFSFDSLGQIGFSKRFGHLEKGNDIGGISGSLTERLHYTSLVGIYPWLHPIFYQLILTLVWFTGKTDYLVVFAEEKIAEHQSLAKEGKLSGVPGMIDSFIAMHQQDPKSFTKNDLLMGACLTIGAGADTTWISIGSAIRYLYKYPHTLKKIRAEIDEMTREGKISDPVTWEESKTMPYLNAVVKEAQRIHAPTGTPLWRDVPESGAVICGRYFPPKTTVGVNTWVAHYSSVFDPDPDTFRPERWLEADKEQLIKMNASYIPFGIGPRICQGQLMALMEVNKAIVQLLRRFEFDLNLDWKTENRWLVEYRGLAGKIKLRENVS